MDFDLRPLPYPESGLEPHIGRTTLTLHHSTHHRGYLAKLKELIGGTPEAEESLETIILNADGPVFDNAAQVWNHEFYWRSMKPEGGGEPTGRFRLALERDFGSFHSFRRAFLEAGAFTQADSEFDRCFKRRGESLALFLDEEPTYGFFPPLYYYQGRVREGLNNARFADSYRAYLDVRGGSTEDPLIADIRKRLRH
jgi:hypothetical protein